MPEQEVNGEGMTILLVEDEEGVRKTVEQRLIRQGFKVVIAVNGLHALQMIKGSAAAVDLVVTDINMPGMNGVEFISELRKEEKTSELPVIVISANSDRHLVQKAVDKGVDGYLLKPFSREDFMAKLSEVLAKIEAASTAAK